MKNKGFTLIELLIVVAIIGILAAVGAVVIPNVLEGSKTTVLKSRHTAIVRHIGEYLVGCEVGGERYFYFVDYRNSNNYIDCQNNNWGLSSQFSEYYKTIYKNPYGALNGSWDHSTYFVDVNQIPTSCKANEVGYSFLTAYNDPGGYFKFGTCYEEGLAPWYDEIKSLNK